MWSDTTRWLLDLRQIPDSAESLRLAWERAVPAWLWALLIVVAIAVAFWSYSRLAGRPWARMTLATMRSATIVLVLMLLAGPALEHTETSTEEDWLLVLLDRSASMQIQDVQNGSATESRDAQLRQLLQGNDDVWQELADRHHVVWLGFDAGAFELTTGDGQTQRVELDEPAGEVTHMSDAIEQALSRAVARPIGGIMIVSDGRTTQQPSRSLLRQLQNNAVEVFTVPLGSPDPLGDLALRRVEAPLRAFVRDRVPVRVELDRLGAAADRIAAEIKLIDETTGEVLDSIRLEPGDDRADIVLNAEPELMGTTTWQVVIEPQPGDLVAENNWRRINIELVDRPLRVLYVEGYPRREYHFFKNLLIREESIDCSIMLISADRDFAQEGNQPITRLPRSPEEFAQFDVIAIGDVPASFFSPDQISMIRDQVAERGAGLLWIAGERSTPRTYAGTLLTDLLPMRGTLTLPPINEPVNLQPTPLAEQLGVLQLRSSSGDAAGWPAELADTRTRWAALHYAQRIEPGRLKPTAEVLAQTTQMIGGSELPIVIQMRYGAGRMIYVATDEIWRWRYGRGELFTEQFWIQIVRMLGRETLGAQGEQAVLTANPRWANAGEPARIEVVLLDQRLSDPQRQTVRAVITRDDDTPFAELELRRLSDADERYAGTAMIDQVGNYRVKVEDTALGITNLSVDLEVARQDDELRKPETDHALLEQLASETGGAFISPANIRELPERIPNRSINTEHSLIESIWDSPFALGMLILLLTAEWVGRKLVRLP